MEFLTPEIIVSFLTLAILEIVLGIDNLIFLSIISQRLPAAQQPLARKIGLALALGLRLALLFALSWIVGLTAPVFSLLDKDWSWRDLILMAGGLFLLYKATTEIHEEIEGHKKEDMQQKATASFASVIAQIAVLDLVFSLDSVLTAVGMVEHIPVMIAAIVTAIVIMLVAAEPVSAFIERHPTVKMLALSFLLLIGVALIADGLHFHIPKGYLYFAIAFSIVVESLNMFRSKRHTKSA